MKNRTRIILVLALVIMSICLFAIASSATEYEVTTSDQFNAAYSSAVDGDTIVIKADISATLNFGKSITYIIDGGHTWRAGAQNSDTNKDVKIFARNGNGVFYPNSNMWCNSYGLTNTNLAQTTWSFGSLDDSILTFDMTAVNVRLSYGVNWEEINILPGAHITNCNNNDVRDTVYFYATTINVYEGAKIYGNYVSAYRGLFKCTTMNIYGGEFYGNLFGEYGMALASSTVNMYGGKIHDTYLNFTNKDVNEGIFKSATFNMYGGEIYNNYVKGLDANKHTIVYGTKRVINGSIHDNYFFTSWTAPTRGENGLWSAALDVSAATELGNGKNSTTLFDYSVIFKNANSSVIDAFMVKDGAVLKSVSSATEITVPSDVTAWASEMNDCGAVTLPVEFTSGATYYVKAEHKVIDDHDCTTALACSKCAQVILEANTTHNESVVITYATFTSAGTKTVTCTNEGCVHNEQITMEALILYLGVSASINDGSICIGYTLNSKNAQEYVAAGNTFRFGVVAYIPQDENDLDPIGDDLQPKDEKYTISAELEANVSAFDFVLKGFTSAEYSIQLIMCAYVYDGMDVNYVSVENKEASQTEQAKVIKFNDYIQEVGN